MNAKKFLVLALLCVFAGASALGCNKGPKKPKDLPKLYPTTITVAYDDGTPVAQATVMLRLDPKTAPSGVTVWNLTGETDAQGKLILKTNGNWDGAPAGTYQAAVTKQISKMKKSETVGGSDSIESITRYVATQFNDPTQSGLTAEIKEGPNEITFKVGEEINENVQAL